MTALTQFESGVAEVRLLLELSSDPPKTERENAVHRACVVLLVSHFESYLKAIAETFSDEISDGNLESRQIPKGIRELHTLPKLREIIESNSEPQRAILLKKLQPLMVLWNDAAKPSRGSLSSSVLARVVTNANSQTIDKLFNLMGNTGCVCDGDLDVPDADGETAPVNIRLSLEDVVKCRNDIAHGDQSRRPTAGDVARYLGFLTAMAKRLDRKAASFHSETSTGDDP